MQRKAEKEKIGKKIQNLFSLEMDKIVPNKTLFIEDLPPVTTDTLIGLF